MPRQQSEQLAFSGRLRDAIRAVGMDESPAKLVKLLARYGGQAVSQQAVSGWLNGRAMPRQANLIALAGMLSVDPQYLQYGANARGAVREPRADYRANPVDALAVQAFYALPARQRALVRQVIEELSIAQEPSRAHRGDRVERSSRRG
jgi:transcriptional regulator with XRE-family HTH domain